ncbi:MAG: hypothetical protein ACOYOV_16520, partial [Bacteroidales bacterium]
MSKWFKNTFFTFSVNLIYGCLLLVLSTQLSYAQIDRNKLQENKKKIEEEIKFTNNLLNETKKNKQASL